MYAVGVLSISYIFTYLHLETLPLDAIVNAITTCYHRTVTRTPANYTISLHHITVAIKRAGL